MVLLLSLLLCLHYTTINCHRICRVTPDDVDWAGDRDWHQLNKTTGGKFIRTVPLASVCHDPSYDEAACSALKEK
jgi:hypothetical protein